MGRPKKNTGLTKVIGEIKRNIEDGFDKVEERINQLNKMQSVTSMEVRDLQIQMKAMQGIKQTDIAKQYNLSEARVSQIIRSSKTQ